MAVLIEAGDPEERPGFGRQLTIDLLAGLGLGAISGLISVALLELASVPLDTIVAVSSSVALTVIVMTALGAVIPAIALRGDGSGWRAPTALISTGFAATGLTVYLVLATQLHDLVRL
ncbi:MAG: hypothetical protein L6413_10160 [Coriobacteriia bacterium]|nr:hypothetical protein [Coriobacteriia bacterium]